MATSVGNDIILYDDIIPDLFIVGLLVNNKQIGTICPDAQNSHLILRLKKDYLKGTLMYHDEWYIFLKT